MSLLSVRHDKSGMFLYYYLSGDQSLRKHHAHLYPSGEKRPRWGAQAQTKWAECSSEELRTHGGSKHLTDGESTPRWEEKMRNSPTLVRAPESSLPSLVVRELSDLNRSHKVLIKQIVIKLQSKVNHILGCSRQTKIKPEGFLVSIENWS